MLAPPQAGGKGPMKDEDLDRLYDEVIRERNLESILRLAVALAEQTPGENTFAQERERTKQLFKERIAELRLTGDTHGSTADLFVRDKLYELRQWLCFLRHTYAGAKASSDIALRLRRATHAVKRMHSLRLEQAYRRRGEEGVSLFKEIKELLDTMRTLSISLHKRGAEGSLALSRGAYIKARRGLWSVYLRSCGRALKRYVFLLVVGFFLASYLLGVLPDNLTISGNTIVNGLFSVLGALGVWAVDRWLLGPHIDRWLARSRRAHLELNLGDLLNALLWAHVCRVFSSSVLHKMIDSSNEEYAEAVKELTNPNFPPGGHGQSVES
jgi:hypothetical protein